MNLQEIRALQVDDLADLAECDVPAGAESAGGRLLLIARDKLAYRWEIYGPLDEANVNALANEIIRAMSGRVVVRWGQFVDLAAWREDPPLDPAGQRGHWGPDLTAAAGQALRQIVGRLLDSLVAELDGDDDPVSAPTADDVEVEALLQQVTNLLRGGG